MAKYHSSALLKIAFLSRKLHEENNFLGPTLRNFGEKKSQEKFCFGKKKEKNFKIH